MERKQIWEAIDRLVALPGLGHVQTDLPEDCLAWNVEDRTVITTAR